MPATRAIRKIRSITKSKPTIEGAGVHLNRAFGFTQIPEFDPFLLLDDFRSDDPRKYSAGFPWHPHRGIETITYVLQGSVEHRDSMGNAGRIGPGDVQWMTAGSGIIHQEMPSGDELGHMGGLQLWANLPASHKMMPPRYRDVKGHEIPAIVTSNGVEIRVVCGTVNETKGPVEGIVTNPEYLDVTIPSQSEFTHPIRAGHTAFAYVLEGSAYFGTRGERAVSDGSVVLFADGEEISASARDEEVRFLLVSGKPIGEPVAWYGPVVMNTDEELQTAFEEFRNGTFIKASS